MNQNFHPDMPINDFLNAALQQLHFDTETIEKAILSANQQEIKNVLHMKQLSLEVLVLVFKARVASAIWPILHPEPKLSTPRTFSANGSITPDMREKYFFVDPSPQNNTLLLPNILKGGWILLHGPRASGKTTRVFKLFDQLQPQYMMLYVTCQMAPDLTTSEAFFGTIMFQIRAALQLPPKLENETFADDFLKLCYTWISEYGKRMVLAIDEFDRLYEMAPTQECTTVLSVFRSLRDTAALRQHGVQSVIAIGTFSILFATGNSGSPFNVSEAIAAPFFSLQDTASLFQQFIKERGRAVPNEVVWDVHQRTSGHPGLVCLCGRALDQKVAEISYSSWLKYATFTLPRELVFYQNTQRMIQDLQQPHFADARHLLTLLVASGMEPLDPGNELASTKVLVALGYARYVDTKKIALMSPLVGHLAMEHVLLVDKRRPPSKPFPMKDGIDIPSMICGAVSAFSCETLELSKTFSFKTHPGIKGHPNYHQQQIVMPCEAVYHAELYSVIQSWKPSNVFLFTNVNVPMENEKDKRCDLSLWCGNYKSYVIELMAHDTQDEIKRHIEKTIVYKKQLDADESYMINFTTVLPDQDYPYLPGQEGVRTIYVWHDLAFAAWRVWWIKDGNWVSQAVVLEH